MNVTSLELSKELYGLSGWNRTDYLWVAPPLNDTDYNVMNKHELRKLNDDVYLENKIYNSTFAYDLGYLLRRLPPKITLTHISGMRWHCFVQLGEVAEGGIKLVDIDRIDTSPEDAVAKLAIEIFKQGILTKEAGDVS